MEVWQIYILNNIIESCGLHFSHLHKEAYLSPCGYNINLFKSCICCTNLYVHIHNRTEK